MSPGDRVKVSAAYGERYPFAAELVGEEGTVRDNPWYEGYITVALDCDDGAAGVFRPNELESAGKRLDSVRHN